MLHLEVEDDQLVWEQFSFYILDDLSNPIPYFLGQIEQRNGFIADENIILGNTVWCLRSIFMHLFDILSFELD